VHKMTANLHAIELCRVALTDFSIRVQEQRKAQLSRGIPSGEFLAEATHLTGVEVQAVEFLLAITAKIPDSIISLLQPDIDRAIEYLDRDA
jgi:hypothetical protein